MLQYSTVVKLLPPSEATGPQHWGQTPEQSTVSTVHTTVLLYNKYTNLHQSLIHSLDSQQSSSSLGLAGPLGDPELERLVASHTATTVISSSSEHLKLII